MNDLLQVVSMKYALAILDALKNSPTGLRNKDFRMVDTPQTKTNTLKALAKAGLIQKSRSNNRRVLYALTKKGAKALSIAKNLQKLDS
jgi:DNA-binding HxlR family transcriptional regulator